MNNPDDPDNWRSLGECVNSAIVAAYLRQAAQIAEETTTELRRRYPKLLKPHANIEDDE